MACSSSLAPLASFYYWRGRSTAGPSHYRTICRIDTSDVDPALPEAFEPMIPIRLSRAHSHPKCDDGFQVVSRGPLSFIFLEGGSRLVSLSRLCIRGSQSQVYQCRDVLIGLVNLDHFLIVAKHIVAVAELIETLIIGGVGFKVRRLGEPLKSLLGFPCITKCATQDVKRKRVVGVEGNRALGIFSSQPVITRYVVRIRRIRVDCRIILVERNGLQCVFPTTIQRAFRRQSQN